MAILPDLQARLKKESTKALELNPGSRPKFFIYFDPNTYAQFLQEVAPPEVLDGNSLFTNNWNPELKTYNNHRIYELKEDIFHFNVVSMV